MKYQIDEIPSLKGGHPSQWKSSRLSGWILPTSTELVLRIDRSVSIPLSHRTLRPDVAAAHPYTFSNGRCGFELLLPISVLDQLSGRTLTLEAPAHSKVLWQHTIDGAVDTTVSDHQLEQFILSAQGSRLSSRTVLRRTLPLTNRLSDTSRKFIHPVTASFQQLFGRVRDAFDQRAHTREMLLKLEPREAAKRPLTVIIPVYNALDAVREVLHCMTNQLELPAELLLVNDRSDLRTSTFLENFAQSCTDSDRLRKMVVKLCVHGENRGFLSACVTGYQHAAPQNDILLINSDTEFPADALSRITEAAYSKDTIGAASPLSTNSPECRLLLPSGCDLKDANTWLDGHWKRKFPTVITPEGQFLYLKRWALDRYGFFDPIYGRGYGEETDLLIRWYQSGVDTVCADNLLIFHRKGASFSYNEQLQLKKRNRKIFFGRWKKVYQSAYQSHMIPHPLTPLRSQLRARSENLTSQALESAEIVFILPPLSVAGGNLSVFQHVRELYRRGIRACIVSTGSSNNVNYPLPTLPIFCSPERLTTLPWNHQKVIATFWSTAYDVRNLKKLYTDIAPYYYVQGYEPWFYSHGDTLLRQQAEDSYRLGLPLIVKTQHLRELLLKFHHVEADAIRPGLDLEIYYPPDSEDPHHEITLVLRLESRWRGGEEALTFMEEIQAKAPHVPLNVLTNDSTRAVKFPPSVSVYRNVSQSTVADLYRRSKVVLDFSQIHGFGRTGIEAMACGAVPILADSGGVREYCRNGENGYLFPPSSPQEAVRRTCEVIKSPIFNTLRSGGIRTAHQYGELGATENLLEVIGHGEYAMVRHQTTISE